MMARRMAGRGRCITSQSITSVPRGSDSLPAVKVWVPWDEWPSVRFADGFSHAPRPPASVANQSGCPSGSPVHSFHWSLYEATASSLHPRPACRLRPKPDGAADAVRSAVESFDGARRRGKRSQKPFRHGAAGSKLWVSQCVDRAQRIWHTWLCSCGDQVRWK